MTVESIIRDLRGKKEFTALENQIAKLSLKEMGLYARANNSGITGEEALSFVFNASLMGIV